MVDSGNDAIYQGTKKIFNFKRIFSNYKYLTYRFKTTSCSDTNVPPDSLNIDYKVTNTGRYVHQIAGVPLHVNISNSQIDFNLGSSSYVGIAGHVSFEAYA